MDLTYRPAQEAFRATVTEFIARHLPPGWRGWGALNRAAYGARAEEWRTVLLAVGWLTSAWPKGYGGGGLSVGEQSILSEELTKAGLPRHPRPTDGLGIGLLGPTLLARGTPEQKEYFLGRTLTGEIRWAQGYSEPDAGSDRSACARAQLLPARSWPPIGPLRLIVLPAGAGLDAGPAAKSRCTPPAVSRPCKQRRRALRSAAGVTERPAGYSARVGAGRQDRR